MAVSVATFKAEFPEFDSADNALVAAKLSYAEERLHENVWGDKLEQGIKVLTARLLALAPQGRKMRLSSDRGRTIYDEDWRALKRSVASGFRST